MRYCPGSRNGYARRGNGVPGANISRDRAAMYTTPHGATGEMIMREFSVQT